MALKVLLDTNVWSYVADQDASIGLRRVAREHDLELLISPAVVFEQLRLQNRHLRKKHLEVTTRRWWTRLMPEAYVECAELVAALRIHRPDWIIENPSAASRRAYHANRSDWLHGFWERARNIPDAQAGYNEDLGGARIDVARTEFAQLRAFSRQNNATLENASLLDSELIDCIAELGRGKRVRTELWRVGAANHFTTELYEAREDRRTYRDWLDPFLDRRRLFDRQSWLSFWTEVDPGEVPTQWVVWAAGVLAPLVKVNDGTVFDVQLSAYLAAADAFLTADKNLYRIVEVLAHAAPFPMARPTRTTPREWPAALAALAQTGTRT